MYFFLHYDKFNPTLATKHGSPITYLFASRTKQKEKKTKES